jgi:hypothetical protein
MSGITRDHIHLMTNLEKILKSSHQNCSMKEINYFNSVLKELDDKKEKKDLKLKQEIKQETVISEKIENEPKKANLEINNNNFEEQRIKNLQSLQSLVPIQMNKFAVINKNYYIKKINKFFILKL